MSSDGRLMARAAECWIIAARRAASCAVESALLVTQIQGISHPVLVENAEHAGPRRLVVVVGASGILAPLGRILKAEGLTTIGVSRRTRADPRHWDRRVTLDARDAHQVAALLSELPAAPSVAVAYGEAVTVDSWRLLANAAQAAVIVLTSRHADPALPERERASWVEPRGVRLLQLGWTADRGWHTPEQVSRAVAASLAAPAPDPVVLGRVRPWSGRPRP